MEVASRLAPPLRRVALAAAALAAAPLARPQPGGPASPPYAPAALPGRGLGQHPFFYAGESGPANPAPTLYVIRGGRAAWSYTIPPRDAAGQAQRIGDATLLSSGNVIFACGTGAALVSPGRQVLWSYQAPKGSEVNVIQPLGLGRAMLIEQGTPPRMMLIDLVRAAIIRQFGLPPGRIGGARITTQDTLVVARPDADQVAEYDLEGRRLWSVSVPSPWAAVRLRNGDTLVSSARGFVREVDPSGGTVWQFGQGDAPAIRIFSLRQAERLANGDTVIANWCAGALPDPGQRGTSVQVLEVTPAKKVVWALRSWDHPDLGPATGIQLLDEPGVPEMGQQQR